MRVAASMSRRGRGNSRATARLLSVTDSLQGHQTGKVKEFWFASRSLSRRRRDSATNSYSILGEENFMKKLSFITVISLGLVAVGAVFAAESVKYDFDDVEVEYAAEFTAEPTSVDPDNWIVQIAGGVDKPITVLYGVVDLKNDGEVQVSEEFIKVGGEGGSERFLRNSAAYDYYEGTSNYSGIQSFFWSAKKLVDNSVVKDKTPPIKSVTFHRKFDESQQMSSILLSFSNYSEQAGSEFWSSVPTRNLYEADMNTLNQSGVPTASSQ